MSNTMFSLNVVALVAIHLSTVSLGADLFVIRAFSDSASVPVSVVNQSRIDDPLPQISYRTISARGGQCYARLDMYSRRSPSQRPIERDRVLGIAIDITSRTGRIVQLNPEAWDPDCYIEAIFAGPSGSTCICVHDGGAFRSLKIDPEGRATELRGDNHQCIIPVLQTLGSSESEIGWNITAEVEACDLVFRRGEHECRVKCSQRRFFQRTPHWIFSHCQLSQVRPDANSIIVIPGLSTKSVIQCWDINECHVRWEITNAELAAKINLPVTGVFLALQHPDDHEAVVIACHRGGWTAFQVDPQEGRIIKVNTVNEALPVVYNALCCAKAGVLAVSTEWPDLTAYRQNEFSEVGIVPGEAADVLEDGTFLTKIGATGICTWGAGADEGSVIFEVELE